MGTLVKIVVILIINTFALQAQDQEVYSLTVKIVEADSNDGQMFISVFNKEDSFLNIAFKGTKSKLTDNGCEVVFEGIPKGTYAVSIYHDENDNGKMDSNFIGIPKEDYACSNDAKGFMGPPKWKDAKFELRSDKTITITL